MRFSVSLIICAMFILISCNRLGLAYMGVRPPKKLATKEIQRYHNSLKITNDTCYQFMPWFFDSMPLYIDTTTGLYKSLYQPLGYQVYDSAGRIVSIVVNCYAYDPKNKRKLNFNLNKKMDIFPPQSDEKITKAFVLNHFLSFTNFPLNQLGKNDFTVLVVYGKWMNRQTNQLMNGVRINQSHIPKNKKVKYIYLNNDNVFANSGL